MKKSTKGALAAGAAAAVLLGGAGSLAYWTAEASLPGGSITNGTLSLTAGSCDSAWKYASGTNAGKNVGAIVPGDSVTKSCTYTVGASGDNLQATVAAPSSLTYTTTGGTPSTLKLTSAATYDLAGTAIANGGKITSADNGKTLTAKFVVTMPYGDATATNANDTKGLTNTLDALSIKLTQDQTAANPN